MGLLIRYLLIAIIVGLATTAQAADFYVSPTGSGSTCSVESPCALADIPWTTVDNEESTLYLMGGTYTDRLDVQHNTMDNILYIRPCSYSASCPSGSDGMVIFDRAAPDNPDSPSNTLRLSSANNVTIDGRKSTTDDTRFIRVKPNNNYGVYIASGKQNIIVRYIEITGMLDEKEGADCYNGSPDCQVYAVSAGLIGAGCEISHNYIYNNWGMADILISTATSEYGVASVHHNTISGGTVNYVNGSGRGIDFYNNTFIVNEDTQVPYDVMHFFNANANLEYIRIYNNKFLSELVDDDSHHIFIEGYGTAVSTRNIRIYNNLFVSASNSPFHDEVVKIENKGFTSAAVDDVIIANNTFVSTGSLAYHVGLSATIPTVYGANDPVLIVNNIFYNGKGIVGDTDISWSSEDDVLLDNNLFYHSSSLQFDWLNAALSAKATYTSTATFNSDHSTDNKTGDPLFTSSSDFTLKAGSPAINAGMSLSDYFTTDNLGNVRPESGGTLWDIGAYEYGASGETPEEPPTTAVVAVSVSGDGCLLSVTGDRTVIIGETLDVTATLNNGWQAVWSGTCPATTSGSTRTCTPTEAGTVVYTCSQIPVLNWVQ